MTPRIAPMREAELAAIGRWLADERVYVPPQIRRIALRLLAEVHRARDALRRERSRRHETEP